MESPPSDHSSRYMFVVSTILPVQAFAFVHYNIRRFFNSNANLLLSYVVQLA